MILGSIEDGIGFGDFDFKTLEDDVQTAYLAREAIVCATCSSRILNCLICERCEENKISYRVSKRHGGRNLDEAEDKGIPGSSSVDRAS